jgi:hypothetical protein
VSALTSSRNETVQPQPSTSKSIESLEIEPKKTLQVGIPDAPPQCALPTIGSNSDNVLDEVTMLKKFIVGYEEL